MTTIREVHQTVHLSLFNALTLNYFLHSTAARSIGKAAL